ncbi:hypothetical protein C8J56DRAFT_949897 [Mycena floridula]|nr:hypothetical protein C8J56DRAFT_949897 [Mycena floridula]
MQKKPNQRNKTANTTKERDNEQTCPQCIHVRLELFGRWVLGRGKYKSRETNLPNALDRQNPGYPPSREYQLVVGDRFAGRVLRRTEEKSDEPSQHPHLDSSSIWSYQSVHAARRRGLLSGICSHSGRKRSYSPPSNSPYTPMRAIRRRRVDCISQAGQEDLRSIRGLIFGCREGKMGLGAWGRSATNRNINRILTSSHPPIRSFNQCEGLEWHCLLCFLV